MIEPGLHYEFAGEVRLLQRGGVPHSLVITGVAKWRYADILSAAHTPELQASVLFTGYVEEEDLPALYGGAELFVFPSLYEGFGLPVLEAMACGAPVVSSRESSMPELGADVPRYFNPYDVDHMTDVIRNVLADDALRAEMSVAGPARATHFSWERAAKETLAVYRRTMQHK